MTPLSRSLAALLLAISIVFSALPSAGQGPASEQSSAATEGGEAVAARLDRLEIKVEATQSRIERPWTWRGALPRVRQDVAAIIEEADGLQAEAQKFAATQEQLLKALGPKPEDGTREADDIVDRRATIEEQLSLHEADKKRARLLKARAVELRDKIDSLIAAARTRNLLDREPSMLSSPFWRDTGNDLARLLQPRLADPQEIPAEKPRDDVLSAAPEDRPLPGLSLGLSPGLFALVIAALLLLSAAARRLSRQALQGSAARETGRFFGALAAALPTVLLTLGADGLAQTGLITPTLRDILVIGTTATALVMFATTLAQGAAEVFTQQPAPGTRHLFAAISVAIGLNFFLDRVHGAILHAPDLLPAGQLVLGILGSILALLVARRRLGEQRRNATLGRNRLLEAARRSRARPWLTLLRLITWLVLLIWIAYPVVFALGFRNLADWLLFGTSGTILAFITALHLALAYRQVTEGFVRHLLRPFALTRLGRRLGPRRGRLLCFWIILLLDLAMIPAVIGLLATIWGFDLYRPVEWLQTLGEEIRIGNIVLTFQDLLWAFILVAALMLATKIIQRILEHRVLPSLEVTEGSRNALVSMTGYLGGAIALVGGLAALQIDLNKLAVVAGALSVGIGFGLQHVVNNFVSGLVMLVERPVKVGDWVVVNGHEGMVRRISVRATEIQTFQKASVLVPNSDLISGTVTNWTLKDRTTRIEIQVGVSFDSDVDKVERILLECADRHPGTLKNPAPRAVLFNFGQDALEFELWAYIDTAEVTRKTMVESEIRKAIITAFNEQAIPWPVAQRDVRVSREEVPWEPRPATARSQP